jgi:branched-chain amino acid transport system permease protein
MSLNMDDTLESTSAVKPDLVTSPTKGNVATPVKVNPWKRWRWRIMWMAILILFPLVMGGNKEWLSVAVFGLIASIGAIGLNVLTGYTGQASLGHGFFLGVGAYTAAVLGGPVNSGTELWGLGWSFLLWVPLAGLVAGVIGFAVGPLALRLHGLYLALATVGLVFIGLHLFSNLKSVTGGEPGRQFPGLVIGNADLATGGSIGPITLNRDQVYYFVVALVLVGVIVFVNNVMKRRIGRAFRAVRDREIAAELLGINLAKTKVTAFVFSSALTGMAGALYGSYLRYTEPNLWNMTLSIQYTAMIIIGGMASVSGAILGAMILTALPQIIDLTTGSNPWQVNLFPFVTNEVGTHGLTTSLFNQMLYAMFLAFFLLFEPQGCMGLYRRLVNKVKNRTPGKG